MKKKLTLIRGRLNAKKRFDRPVDRSVELHFDLYLQQKCLKGGGVHEKVYSGVKSVALDLTYVSQL